MEQKKFSNIIIKLKKAIRKAVNESKTEDALSLIKVTSNILYSVNQYYFDEDLENHIGLISKSLCKHDKNYEALENVILFYDGFGLNSRGLIQIYLKALCNIGKVIYVSYEGSRGNIPDVLKLLKENGAEAYFIGNENYLDKIAELKNIFEFHKPQCAFLYTTPDDVVGISTFRIFDNCTTRYLINLTDHAFWLGKDAVDCFIEFRDYGASVSKKYRGISDEKIIKLPFYPQIDRNIKFAGFPKGMDESKRFIFSGGALYKTLGGDGLYYKLLDYMLNKYIDINFWYAGNGERSQMDILMKKYPNRVFLTNERRDFFQIIEKCYFYLSTYPLCGGLMFQYAASAGKIPVTLKYDEDLTKGFLLGNENLNFEFDDFDSLKVGLDKFLCDVDFVRQQEKCFKESVIEEKVFHEQLEKICKYNSNDFAIDFYDIYTDRFREEYLKRTTYGDVCIKLCGRKNNSVFKYLPKEYIYGTILKMIRKIKKHL